MAHACERVRREEAWRKLERPHLECVTRCRMVSVSAPRLRAGTFRIAASPAQGLRRRYREAGPKPRRPGVVSARAVLATRRLIARARPDGERCLSRYRPPARSIRLRTGF